MVNESGPEQSKRLTNTANRILSLLIESPGRVLERDYLLEKVWEDVGHPGSSSSLSQYISILRKTLTSLILIDEVIISVPRVGFYFSQDIAVERLDTDDKSTTLKPVSVSTQSARLKDKKPLWLGAIIVLLLLGNLWIGSKPRSSLRFASLYSIGDIGKCKFTAFNNLSDEMDPQVLKILLHLEPDLEQKCSQNPAQIMVHFQPSVLYGSHGRFFYAYCPTDKKTQKVVYCENHYSFHWEIK